MSRNPTRVESDDSTAARREIAALDTANRQAARRAGRRRFCGAALVGALSFLLPRAAHAYSPFCNCPMCQFIRRYGVQAWNDYLAGRWRDPARVDVIGTPTVAVDAMLDGLALRPADVLYDLGCGDGRILIRAVERFGCRGIGIEIDPNVANYARQRLSDNAIRTVRIVTGDARKYDLSGADAVTMYLFPELMAQLVTRLRTERIASYQHRIPLKRNRRLDTAAGPVYLADGPLVQGSWRYPGWAVIRK